MVSVIKKRGGQEQFDIEKLKRSIEGAAKRAGFDVRAVKGIAKSYAKKVEGFFAGKTKVKSTEIRARLLAEIAGASKKLKRLITEYKRYKKKK